VFREFRAPEKAHTHLTPHEMRILKLLVEGHDYQTAANPLDGSINTIRLHVRSIDVRLQVHSKSEAVSKALRGRIVRYNLSRDLSLHAVTSPAAFSLLDCGGESGCGQNRGLLWNQPRIQRRIRHRGIKKSETRHMPNPPLGVPGSIQFQGVPLGSSATANGGGSLHFHGDVVVRIDGDTTNVFSVKTVEAMALRRDPDAPPGSGLAWQTVITVDGPGPMSMKGAGAIDVTVGFACALSIQQSEFSATAVVLASGTIGPPLMQIPIQATVDMKGKIALVTTPCPLLVNGILAGKTENLEVFLKSTVGHDVSGLFAIPAGRTPFSSPQVLAIVPARGSVPVTLPVTCAAGTGPGRIDGVPFQFLTMDDIGNSNYSLSITIMTGRTVTVTTNPAGDLTLSRGSSMLLTITAFDSGGLSQFNIQSHSVPDGISLNLGSPRTISSGGPFPNDSRVVEVDATLSASVDSPAGRLPLPVVLNWDVPTDGTHPELSGVITLNVNVAVVPVISRYCDFFDPPGSIQVAPTAWGLKNGLPRKSQLNWSASSSVNGSPSPIPITADVQLALAAWNTAAPALTFTQVPVGADIAYGVQDLGAPGASDVTLGSTKFDGSTVNFNSDPAVFFAPRAPGNPSLLAVAIHETGHALGLLHSTNPNSVMFPFTTVNETLSSEDIAAIRALYGWAPQVPVLAIGSDAGPALCGCGSTLVLAWKGIGDDHNIHFATSGDGRTWAERGSVPGAASSHGPSLAWDGTLLWMVWKGVPGDAGLYFATWNLTGP
jgi:DNA-binding CsgD family transcriptional regulator